MRFEFKIAELLVGAIITGIAFLVREHVPYITSLRLAWLGSYLLFTAEKPLRFRNDSLDWFRDCVFSINRYTIPVLLPRIGLSEIVGAIFIWHRIYRLHDGTFSKVVALIAYPLASFATFFILAGIDHQIILPAITPALKAIGQLQDSSVLLPNLYGDVHLAYQLLNSSKPAFQLWDKQTDAYCNLDALESLLFERSNDASTQTESKMICNRTRPVQHRKLSTGEILLDPLIKTKLRSVQSALHPPLLYWHREFHPSLWYLFDSVERLDRHLQASHSNTFVDNAFATDPAIMQQICSNQDILLLQCYWYHLQNELLELFGTTQTWWKHLFQSYSVAKTRNATHYLRRDLCTFAKALPVKLTMALDSGVDLHKDFEDLIGLLERFQEDEYSKLNASNFPPLSFNPQNATRIVNPVNSTGNDTQDRAQDQHPLSLTMETSELLSEATGILQKGPPIDTIRSVLADLFGNAHEWRDWKLGDGFESNDQSIRDSLLPTHFLDTWTQVCKPQEKNFWGMPKERAFALPLEQFTRQGRYFSLLARLTLTVRHGISIVPVQDVQLSTLNEAKLKAMSQLSFHSERPT